MPDFYKGKIPIVYRSLNEGFLRGTPDEAPTFGCVPRDYDVDPPLMGDSPSEMKLVDPSEYDDRYDQGEKNEDSLEHIYLRSSMEHLDQGQFPDCWCHSTAHCQMLDRLKQNLEPVALNGVAMATLIGMLDGGWSALSMKKAREIGFPVMGDGPGEWPKWTRNKKYDTAELRASMAKHKAEEVWYDFGRREYDQVLTRRQIDTCGFNNIPCGVDYNEFGHAMCFLRRVRTANGWGDLILNSWKGFGYRGLMVLMNRTPNNAVGLRSSTPSAR